MSQPQQPHGSTSRSTSWTLRTASDAAERDLAFEIRRQVFVVGQDCPPEEEFDEFEDTSQHILGFAGDRPVATARWRVVEWEGGKAAKLERFAVLESHRGCGYGALLVEHLLREADRAELPAAILHAQAHLDRFYGSFGFERRGEEFAEAGIPHVLMVRRT